METKESVKPKALIVFEVLSMGIKRKWRKPKKIRDWVLYKNWQRSFFTTYTYPRLSGYTVQFVSKANFLYPFDRELIKKRFPISRQFLI